MSRYNITKLREALIGRKEILTEFSFLWTLVDSRELIEPRFRAPINGALDTFLRTQLEFLDHFLNTTSYGEEELLKMIIKRWG